MLTIRTSSHIATNCHRKNFRFSPASTGAPRARLSETLLVKKWIQLLDAEARRLWLDDRWSAHARRVKSRTSWRQL